MIFFLFNENQQFKFASQTLNCATLAAYVVICVQLPKEPNVQ